jgi:hypothetical protein
VCRIVKELLRFRAMIKQKMFEKKVGNKRDAVAEDWKNSHIEKFNTLHSLNIIVT